MPNVPEKPRERAQEKLAKGGLSDKEYKIVEAKLQRALSETECKKLNKIKSDSREKLFWGL